MSLTKTQSMHKIASLEHDDVNKAKRVTFSGTAGLDGFGRLRVSQITALLDIKQVYDKAPLLIDEETNGTATSSFNSNESSVTMTTSADSDYVVRQTFQRTNYQVGKCQQILMTAYGFEAETNITKRIGYFSSATSGDFSTSLDGLFLESSGGEVSINVYRNGTEIESTAQSSWNVDKLDGTGDSGTIIDWSQNQIFFIDFEWLGVGEVRWGVVVDGDIIIFHTSSHANSTTKVYMSSPNQPLRWEIRQSGAGSGSFTHVCSSVGTEGSLNYLGVERTVANTDKVDANSTGTTYAVLGIRLKSDYVDKTIDLKGLSIIARTNDDFKWSIQFNPTVAGTFTYGDVSNSALQSAEGATANTVTNGTMIASGFVTGNQDITLSLESALKLGSALDGTVDEIVLCVEPLSSNLDIWGSLVWTERT